eukprot:GCRY01001574.1.p1 GENE.GCRY01001574.1~~GCRY01001574.1.p1  ORF type:complete len:377 (+),score=67.69 GCRY01001574.1:116-1246(+)
MQTPQRHKCNNKARNTQNCQQLCQIIILAKNHVLLLIWFRHFVSFLVSLVQLFAMESKPGTFPNILGVQHYIEDTTRAVGNFLLKHLQKPNVEIEVRFGNIRNNNSQTRQMLNVLGETPLAPDSFHTHFFAALPEVLFKHYYQVLNHQYTVLNAAHPNSVQYSHFVENDVFYNNRIRVSYDQEGNELRRIVKHRLESLDVHSPTTSLDFRISAMTEDPIPETTVLGEAVQERVKDRRAYGLPPWSFELTKVTTYTLTNGQRAGQADAVTYELEMEVQDMALLKHEAALHTAHHPSSRFTDFVRTMLLNVRSLLSMTEQRFKDVLAAYQRQLALQSTGASPPSHHHDQHNPPPATQSGALEKPAKKRLREDALLNDL